MRGGREAEGFAPKKSCSYIGDVEIARVPQPTPLGVGEAEGLYDAVVGQCLLLGRGDAGVGEVVAC